MKSQMKMAFWRGEFFLGNNIGSPKDTFLSFPGWHKGVAFVNGFNLGRYWPVVGPQKTLYLPQSILKQYPEKNSIIVLEQEHAPCDHELKSQESCFLEMVDTPDIDGTTPKA